MKGWGKLKTTIDNFSEEVKKAFEGWVNEDLINSVNESLKETATEAVKELKKGGPYEKRTGEYSKNWTYKQTDKRTAAITGISSYTIYNKNRYQLTHLLEKGHQLCRGGRSIGKVKAFEHIAPVNEKLGDLAVSKIERKMRG